MIAAGTQTIRKPDISTIRETGTPPDMKAAAHQVEVQAVRAVHRVIRTHRMILHRTTAPTARITIIQAAMIQTAVIGEAAIRLLHKVNRRLSRTKVRKLLLRKEAELRMEKRQRR